MLYPSWQQVRYSCTRILLLLTLPLPLPLLLQVFTRTTRIQQHRNDPKKSPSIVIMRSGGGRPTAAVANILYGRIGRFRMRNLVGNYPGSASHNCASRIMPPYWPPVCAGSIYPNSFTSMRRHHRAWPTCTGSPVRNAKRT